ncbi:hypothetical protein D3C85_901670 [compost metagenome]
MHRAQLVAHLGIQHQQTQRAAAALQAVALGQLAQLQVGVLHQQVEVVALGDLAEGGAVGRADQRADPPPAQVLGLRCGDAFQQLAALGAAAVVFDQCGAHFDAVLLGLIAALLLFAQGLLQHGRLRRFGLFGLVRGQLLAALVETHLALRQGFAGLLQALAQLGQLASRADQQSGEGSVVQLRMASPPGGQFDGQVVTLLPQCLLALAQVVALAGELDPLLARRVQCAGAGLLGGAGAAERLFQALLPDAGAGLLAQALAQASQGTLLAGLQFGQTCAVSL